MIPVVEVGQSSTLIYNDDITTHYSAAELEELINAAESIVSRGKVETPNLMLIRKRTEGIVGKVSAV